jgi:hypothetical protein
LTSIQDEPLVYDVDVMWRIPEHWNRIYVLDSEHRARIASDPRLAPYANCTVPRALGLFNAFLNYEVRLHPEGSPPKAPGCSLDPIAIRAHEALMGTWQSTLSAAVGGPTVREPIFPPEVREWMRGHKYLRAVHNLDRIQFLNLVAAFSEYSEVAPAYELLTATETLPASSAVGWNRCLHAHNCLVSFRNRPMTVDEFVTDLHEQVLSRS